MFGCSETFSGLRSKPLAMSLFSGCGGCSLGLKEAGYELALGAELISDACASYRKNVSRRILACDLSKVTAENLLDAAGVSHKRLDILVAGPPCQGFSSAGGRAWSDPRNILYRQTVELVEQMRPTWVVLENVEGILTASGGTLFIEAIEHLLGLGYWVKARKVYMEEYGIPQRRKRVLIVANIENNEFDFPDPLYNLGEQSSLFGSQTSLSVLDAISDLPEPSESNTIPLISEPASALQVRLRANATETTWHRAKQMSDTNLERVKAIRPGQTMKDLPTELQHPSFARRANRRVMDGTPTEKRGGAPSGMKRLVGGDPSLTITSAASSEFIHPIQDRLLTLREAARIQTFPDDFRFEGGWTSVATQIGNAIPPLYMELLGKHILCSATFEPSLEPRGRWLGISASKATGFSPALELMLRNLNETTLSWA